mgnify:CR=1 FL=1
MANPRFPTIASTTGKGLPIGSLTSQHLANFYLAPLDHFVKERLGVRRYLRYMDELLLFGDAKETLWESSRHVGAFLGSELRLKLKPAATVPAPVSEGVPFLGLRVWPAVRRLSRRRKTRFLRAMRRLASAPSETTVASAAGAVEAARMADTLTLRRAPNRNRNDPANRNDNIGFRPSSSRRRPAAVRPRTLRPRPGRDPLLRSRAGRQAGRTGGPRPCR